RNADVEGVALAAILGADDADLVAVLRQHLRRVVGRAVVDHQDLDVGIGLVQDAVDRERQEAAVVVRIDKRGYQGTIGRHRRIHAMGGKIREYPALIIAGYFASNRKNREANQGSEARYQASEMPSRGL